MEQMMCSEEVIVLPHETITIELLGRNWIVEFIEWKQMSGTRLGFCLCGFRIEGDERTLVRVNADYIERINNIDFKFIPIPTH